MTQSSDSKKTARNRYPDEFREHALALASRIGVAKAASELNLQALVHGQGKVAISLTRHNLGGFHLLADRMGPGHRQQAIQYRHTDGNLRLLSRKTPGA